MTSSAKPLFLLILVVIAIPLFLLGGLNLALQNPGVQERIRGSISRSLGIPLSIKGYSATLCGGIKITGISTGTADESTPHFTIEALTIYPDLMALFHREIIVKELQLDAPVVETSLIHHNPPSDSSAQQTAPEQISVETNTVGQNLNVTPTQTSPSEIVTIALPPSAEKILHHLPHLTIRRALLTLLNANNQPIITMSGVDLTGVKDGDGAWNGNITAQQITIGKALIIHDLHSPIDLTSDASKLSLTTLAATLGGGKLTGNFSILTPPQKANYQAQLTLSGASLTQFFLDASLGSCATEGIIKGDLQLSGVAGTRQSMEGKGSLLCTDAVIQPADFLRQIGQILSIQELQMLRLSEGKINFRFVKGEPLIDELTLRSENLILTAQGPVNDQGNLDLKARLLFNEKLTARLKGLLGSQLSAAPEAGYSQVAFHVTGPAKTPKTDLLERLTGIHIGGDLGGFLQGIFGGHH